MQNGSCGPRESTKFPHSSTNTANAGAIPSTSIRPVNGTSTVSHVCLRLALREVLQFYQTASVLLETFEYFN